MPFCRPAPSGCFFSGNYSTWPVFNLYVFPNLESFSFLSRIFADQIFVLLGEPSRTSISFTPDQFKLHPPGPLSVVIDIAPLYGLILEEDRLPDSRFLEIGALLSFEIEFTSFP